MKFIIRDEIFEIFPNYVVGVVTGKNLIHDFKSSDLSQLLNESIQTVLKRFPEESTLSNEPSIKVWRDSFQKLGLNPKDYACSVDAMIRRIIKKGSFPSINPIVDLINSLALRHIVPIGTHDTDKLTGDIEIRVSKQTDIFTPMGGVSEHINREEFVYADSCEVRTRKWVWRQGDKAKVFPDTKNVFCPIDGFSDVNLIAVEKAAEELEILLKKYFNADTHYYLVNKQNPRIEI